MIWRWVACRERWIPTNVIWCFLPLSSNNYIFGSSWNVLTHHLTLVLQFNKNKLKICCIWIFIQVMLMNPQWCESQESRIVLQETPQCAAIFPEFLRYFYTGQIRISQSTIMGILTLADKYNVKVSPSSELWASSNTAEPHWNVIAECWSIF